MAKFLPGVRPEGAGRPAGTPNKRTQKIQETATRLGVDPFEVLLLYAKGDWQALGYESEKYCVGINEYGSWEKWTIDPNTRAKCAMEAIQYLAPKLKSIEHIIDRPADAFTPEQRVEMLRAAANALENESSRNRSSAGDGGRDNSEDQS